MSTIEDTHQNSPAGSVERHIGFFGAVGVGVGAIVGGGILALAGVAFASTGPSALVAFALNGLIAVFTALSFAEVSSKFPESGGTYTFAKKVLSVEAAFVVGWVVWFASIVAAALYALGFAEFAKIIVLHALDALGTTPPPFVLGRTFVTGLALAATLVYVVSLSVSTAGGGWFSNVGKVVVFAVLIAFGLWALKERSPQELQSSLTPFFSEGWAGLLRAMGFTFIALQGFDLIAAVAGEVRQPERTIPRAMLLSLLIALLIYLPLLFVVATVGMGPGQSVQEMSLEHGETIIAIAAQQFLGGFGYWLVVLAAILSMLSALQANLFAASRVAAAMAQDRTLPRALGKVSRRTNSPLNAILATGVVALGLLILVPDVAAAGAAASLIFLITFALAHWIAILVRERSGERKPPFRVPLFPAIPVIGGLACVALALYQGVVVPQAGVITTVWLSVGGLLFLGLFARRARVADASTAALDPELVRLRGRSPLVLVPLANPNTAPGLVTLATALAPPDVGRVLLLSVVVVERRWNPTADPRPLEKTHEVLSKAINASVESGFYPEALATVAEQPWSEISRVAGAHRCESLLLGLSHIGDSADTGQLDDLISRVDCDIVVLRAAEGWQLSQVRRILIPSAGRGGHDLLLARLLGSLSRDMQRQITLFRVLQPTASQREERTAQRDLRRMANDLRAPNAIVEVVRSDDPSQAIADRASSCDLLVLGVQRVGRHRRLFGDFGLRVARATTTPLLLIGNRG